MFFYITHDLLPSMFLFIMGFGLVCLAAAMLLLLLKGAQKMSSHVPATSSRRTALAEEAKCSTLRERFNSVSADLEVVKIGDMEAVKMGRFSLRT
jgi:hypothetical protein